ncbi:ubiquitin carboxyl-terminal hydrolase [Encephalitozoon intestinalis ATCC 50506]|uniref:ubiquitinyl hydrolase 1 n=1 Tax=Encephalitozoon intestinalis (strain ATCC 50506) TaxID=876142 RepID=E0S7L2_ENCIT|nr:ubiquitin carboxyl-terminal hydrolase [Encephalitozoon intestinalis ATCC 50506]ADM11691.1 ubiquitin carboxyl-terminal hydrolase [Encephalitozoon intestinalis ATCC 50506]UTX45428.1 ubiquitin carboxyl-terminal hydrolase [Encephalitozoon intestinalis]
MKAEESRGQSPVSDQGLWEYAVSSIFTGAQRKFREALVIPGLRPPGPRIHFVPKDVWKAIKEDLSTECNPCYEYREEPWRAVFVTFVIDELVPNTNAPETGRSMVVKVGWILSILQSLVSLNDFRSYERPCRTGGMGKSRKIVNVLSSSTDRVFDVVLEIMGFEVGLDEFMSLYRIMALDGRVIHPLVKLEGFGDGSVLRISRIVRMPDGRALSADSHMKNIARGLKNQGNTCFMNSGLQCLTNCWKLTEYFMSKEYEKHLDETKPIHVSLANAYYDLISEMYNGDQQSIVPSGIRASLGSVYEEYKGNEEQDAAEFIGKTLDMLHEGLSKGYGDSEKKESWKRSIVTDLFFFSQKSTLTCKECGRSKTSVEPSMCLSLPIPYQREYKENIVLFYESGRRQPLRTYADVSSSIGDLKRILRADYDVAGKVTCIWYGAGRRMFELGDDVILKDVPQTLFCYEYFEDKKYCWVHLKTKKLFIDRSFKFNILIRAFGSNESLIFLEMKKTIAHLVEREAQCILEREDISPYFKLEIAAWDYGEKTIDSPVVVAISRSHGGKRLFGASWNPLDTIRAIDAPSITLQHCLDKFLEKEDLHPSELLHCEGCGRKRRFSKKMDLECLPVYLIVQLKRFQYVNSFPVKISTLVGYSLDRFSICGTEYKVIGVCNHDSDTVTSSGHYVSYLRKDGWYLCNDQKIEKVSKIDQEYTYVLFLERCV